MLEYIKGASIILNKGFNQEPAREGMVGTKSYTALQLRFDLSKGTVPILTTKKMPFRMIMTELLWLLNGDTNIQYLLDHDCHIWDDNAYSWYKQLQQGCIIPGKLLSKQEFLEKSLSNDKENIIRNDSKGVYCFGDLGKVYGYQWRKRRIDQIQRCVNMILNNPNSRQNKVVAWNTDDMGYDDCAQPNCHGDFQIITKLISDQHRVVLLKEEMGNRDMLININDIPDLLVKHNIPTREFTLHLTQRSGDYALGIPFNITSYGMLMYILGIITNAKPKMLIITITDAHIYNDHIETLKEQCNDVPFESPTVLIKGRTIKQWMDDKSPEAETLDGFIRSLAPADFKLVNYKCKDKISYNLHTGNAKV